MGYRAVWFLNTSPLNIGRVGKGKRGIEEDAWREGGTEQEETEVGKREA